MQPRTKAKIIGSLLCIVLLLVAAAVLWVKTTTEWWHDSEGERAGYVQKFSKKGWLCKTWEGEIAMVTMPGAIPEKFAFTVTDEKVAERINAAAGHRVSLHYQQHKFIPSTCFGETEYFVVGLKYLDGEPRPENGNVAPPLESPAASAPAAVSAPAAASAPAATSGVKPANSPAAATK